MMTIESAFLARLSGILDRASAAWPGDLTLVAFFSREVSELRRVSVDHAARGLPPPGATTGVRLPPGLSLPVLLGPAVDAARVRLPDLAAELAGEASRILAALVPDRAEELAAAEPLDGTGPLVAGWPLLEAAGWPTDRELARGIPAPDPELAAARDALAMVARVDPLTRYPWPIGDADTLPPDVDREDLAAWAFPLLSRAGLLVGDMAVLNAEDLPPWMFENGGSRSTPLIGWGSSAGGMMLSITGPRDQRWPPRALALVYSLSDTGAPCAGLASGAARRAFLRARDLVGPRDGLPGAFTAAVRAALDGDGAGDLAAELLGDVPRLSALAAELREVARGIVARVLDGDPPGEADATRTGEGPHGPALAWDLDFARQLTEIGPEGLARADKIQRSSAERAGGPPADRWALWTGAADGAPRWLRALARVLWSDRWRPRIERQQYATVLHPVVLGSAIGMLRTDRAGPVYADGDRMALLGPRREELARVLLDAHTATFPNYTPERLRRIFASTTAHRWLRYILPELQSSWMIHGRETVLTLDGGKSGIIERMRAAGVGGSRADGQIIAEVIAAVGRIEARTERTCGTFYAYEMPSTPDGWRTYAGRPASPVRLTPGPLLDPHRIFDDPDHRGIPLSRTFPPLQWADRSSHAGILTLSIILVRELHNARAELAEEGGVLWGPEKWCKMLVESTLADPGPIAWETTRDALLTDGRSDVGSVGGSPVPPFLQVTTDGRIHLHPEHRGARAWLDGAAERFARASKRGEAATRRRKKGR